MTRIKEENALIGRMTNHVPYLTARCTSLLNVSTDILPLTGYGCLRDALDGIEILNSPHPSSPLVKKYLPSDTLGKILFPIQNFENIFSRRSPVVTSPVISPTLNNIAAA